MIRRAVVAVALCLVAAAGPSHAADALWGTGFVTSANCSGGRIVLAAVNTSGTSWTFDVTVVCTASTPQHVAIAGTWNPSQDPRVVPIPGTGVTGVLRVTCSGSSSVTVQVQMTGSPLVAGTVTLNRSC